MRDVSLEEAYRLMDEAGFPEVKALCEPAIALESRSSGEAHMVEVTRRLQDWERPAPPPGEHLTEKWVSEVVSRIEDFLPIGTSKIGGEPDLPPGVEWPHLDDIPYSFIAQINLSDVAAVEVETMLPRSGLLYFFSVLEGFDEEEGCFCRVIFYDDDLSLLRRAPFPEGIAEQDRFSPCTLHFYRSVTIPESGPFVESLKERDDEERAWRNYLKLGDNITALSERIPAPRSRIAGGHQMFGHPTSSHYPVLDAVQWWWGYVPQENMSEQESISAHMLKPQEWRLLLQVAEDAGVGIDVILQYFCIHQDDLANQRFEKTRLDLQH